MTPRQLVLGRRAAAAERPYRGKVTTRPSSASRCSARLTVPWPTSSSRASTATEGIRWPGSHSPAASRARSRRVTRSVGYSGSCSSGGSMTLILAVIPGPGGD